MTKTAILVRGNMISAFTGVGQQLWAVTTGATTADAEVDITEKC